MCIRSRQRVTHNHGRFPFFRFRVMTLRHISFDETVFAESLLNNISLKPVLCQKTFCFKNINVKSAGAHEVSLPLSIYLTSSIGFKYNRV